MKFITFVFVFVLMTLNVVAQDMKFVRTLSDKVDTVDVTKLAANYNQVEVDTIAQEGQSSVRIIESVEFENLKNKELAKQLALSGYFDMVPVKNGNTVCVSDHSEKSIRVGNEQIIIRRKYRVIAPVGKHIVLKK